MPRVEAFPWSELPNALAAESDLSGARRVAIQSFATDQLGPLLRELFGAELEATGVASCRRARAVQSTALTARLVTNALELVARPEPELVAFALRRLLDQPFRLSDPGVAPNPHLVGAWRALALELARRLCRGEPPRLAWPQDEQRLGPASVFDVWLRVDGRSFRVELGVIPLKPPPRRDTTDVPVTLPLVAGRTSLSRSTLEGLRLGDALLLGSGWFDAATPTTTAVAVAPTEERGFRLSIADAVRYVEGAQVPHDDVTAAGAENPVDDATKESVIADTPVVVRVEVGSITLNAQEWMQLEPGDVLSCGVPPQSPVVLRAAGREIARGELVTVDGEVGVRISRLAGGADDETLPSPVAPTSR